MGFEARPPDAFGQILLQDVAFLSNAAACCVLPGGAEAVDVQRCVLLEAAEQVAAPSPPFIAVTSPRTRVDFGDSLIVRRSLEGFVSRWSASHPSPSEYQPVTIRDSRLVLDEAPPGGCAIPTATASSGRRSRRPGGSFEQLSTRVDALASEARRGARPQLSELAEQLVPQ